MKLQLSILLLSVSLSAVFPAGAATAPDKGDSLWADDSRAGRYAYLPRIGRLPWLGLKSNLLYDATATLNAGIEIGLSRHWTLDVSANYNPWTFSDNRKWKHLLVQPELRYWFGHRFGGHFLGVHSGWVKYNVGGVTLPCMGNSRTSRYEGHATGVGLAYGYSARLSGRWALEFSLGAGWIYTRYDRFRCPHCGAREESGSTASRFAPTKAAVSVVYMLGGDPLPGRERRRKPDAARDRAGIEEISIKAAEEQEEAVHRAEETRRIEETRRAEQQQVQKAEEEVLQAKRLALQAKQEKLRTERLTALRILRPVSGEELAVLFPSGKSDIDVTFCGNDTILGELLSAVSLLCAPDSEAVAMTAVPAPRYRIEITGYASPDGRAAFNNRLSQKRAVALKEYLRERLPELPDSLFVLHNAGEDWEGVRRWVTNDPGMIYREEVLRIIDRVAVNGGREKRLMDLKWGRPYMYLFRNCFPTLRNACCVGVRIETTF